MVGLATRLIALPLVFNFIVAFLTASRSTVVQLFAGPQRSDAYDAFINDSAFPMLILALAMLAFGPGKASLDQILRSKLLPMFRLNRDTESHAVQDSAHFGDRVAYFRQ